MEKIVTNTSCCGIFFGLYMDPKFPNAELFEIAFPEPFCENYTVM